MYARPRAARVVLFSTLSRLAAKTPDACPPSRILNVAVVLDASRIHPQFQPFEAMTDVTYASDFDPATSSVEHAAC